jgi:hypothetical protein
MLNISSVVSFDELVLKAIFKRTFPDITIEQQVEVPVKSKRGNYKMDFRLTLGNKSVFVEYDGPLHFLFSQAKIPESPLLKKRKVEDAIGIEVVNWAYWMQKCEANEDYWLPELQRCQDFSISKGLKKILSSQTQKES